MPTHPDPDDGMHKKLLALCGGDEVAGHRLLGQVYETIHTLASRCRRREGKNVSFVTTDLAHDAYLRLARDANLAPSDAGELQVIIAVTIRREVIERARRRNAKKRGGGMVRAPETVLEEMFDAYSEQNAFTLLRLEEALEWLERVHARQARVVMLRFFSGLTLDETAEALGVSRGTVRDDWRYARALLAHRMSEGEES